MFPERLFTVEAEVFCKFNLGISKWNLEILLKGLYVKLFCLSCFNDFDSFSPTCINTYTLLSPAFHLSLLVSVCALASGAYLRSTLPECHFTHRSDLFLQPTQPWIKATWGCRGNCQGCYECCLFVNWFTFPFFFSVALCVTLSYNQLQYLRVETYLFI